MNASITTDVFLNHLTPFLAYSDLVHLGLSCKSANDLVQCVKDKHYKYNPTKGNAHRDIVWNALHMFLPFMFTHSPNIHVRMMFHETNTSSSICVCIPFGYHIEPYVAVVVLDAIIPDVHPYDGCMFIVKQHEFEILEKLGLLVEVDHGDECQEQTNNVDYCLYLQFTLLQWVAFLITKASSTYNVVLSTNLPYTIIESILKSKITDELKHHVQARCGSP